MRESVKMKKNKTFQYYCNTGEKPRTCFCIGPENCKDKTCKMVQDYESRKRR